MFGQHVILVYLQLSQICLAKQLKLHMGKCVLHYVLFGSEVF